MVVGLRECSGKKDTIQLMQSQTGKVGEAQGHGGRIEWGVSEKILEGELFGDVGIGDHGLETLQVQFAIAIRIASMMVLSTICWSCWSLRLFPTIILSTRNSSPLEMSPSRSMS